MWTAPSPPYVTFDPSRAPGSESVPRKARARALVEKESRWERERARTGPGPGPGERLLNVFVLIM